MPVLPERGETHLWGSWASLAGAIRVNGGFAPSQEDSSSTLTDPPTLDNVSLIDNNDIRYTQAGT